MTRRKQPAENLWLREIGDALVRIENRRRLEDGLGCLPDDSFAWIPEGDAASLQLHNLRVWTLRYHVSLDFILEFLLRAYARRRKISPRLRPRDVMLGLPASLLGGEVAKRRLEEEIARAFPARENRPHANKERPLLPLRELSGEDDEDYVQAYSAIMKRYRSKKTPRPFVGRPFRSSEREFRLPRRRS